MKRRTLLPRQRRGTERRLEHPRAKALYNAEGWGAGCFDVSERGRAPFA
jgi:hypothetical protein